MFSLQRLLGKEDMFFELLEASAQEAHNSVQSLVRLSKALDKPVELEEFARARRKDKEITFQIRNAIYTTFVTALETRSRRSGATEPRNFNVMCQFWGGTQRAFGKSLRNGATAATSASRTSTGRSTATKSRMALGSLAERPSDSMSIGKGSTLEIPANEVERPLFRPSPDLPPVAGRSEAA